MRKSESQEANIIVGGWISSNYPIVPRLHRDVVDIVKNQGGVCRRHTFASRLPRHARPRDFIRFFAFIATRPLLDCRTELVGLGPAGHFPAPLARDINLLLPCRFFLVSFSLALQERQKCETYRPRSSSILLLMTHLDQQGNLKRCWIHLLVGEIPYDWQGDGTIQEGLVSLSKKQILQQPSRGIIGKRR